MSYDTLRNQDGLLYDTKVYIHTLYIKHFSPFLSGLPLLNLSTEFHIQSLRVSDLAFRKQ